jgi:hypothetical protein
MQARNTFSFRKNQIKDMLRRPVNEGGYGINMPLFDSYLRIKLPLLNNQSQYNFNPVAQSNNIALPQVQLKISDGFYCYGVGLFLEREQTAKTGKAVLQTYPNATAFPAVAGPPAFDPTDLEVVYNGLMQIQINQTVVSQAFPTEFFRSVQTTLQSANNTQSERLVDDGFVELEPNLKLAGTQNINFAVQIPTFSGITLESQAVGFVNNLVLMPIGFLLPNGSAIFEKYYERNAE